MAGPVQRTPEEIRESIELNRRELAISIRQLQGSVERATDWRGALRRNRQQAIVGAAVAGFVVGGGVAAFAGLFRRG